MNKVLFIANKNLLENNFSLAKQLEKRNINIKEFTENNRIEIIQKALEFLQKGKSSLTEEKTHFLFIYDIDGIFAFNMACKENNVVCAHLENYYTAEMTRRHNNSNTFVFDSESLSSKGILKCVDICLKTKYEKGRHNIRLKMMEEDFENSSK